MTPVNDSIVEKFDKTLLFSSEWDVFPTEKAKVLVRAFPATLIFPLTVRRTPLKSSSEKQGAKRALNTYLIYLKSTRYFQKLILYNIAFIQLAKKVGSLNLTAAIKILNDSCTKIRWPKILWNVLILLYQREQRQVSLKDREPSKNGLSFKKTFFPVKNSTKWINVL